MTNSSLLIEIGEFLELPDLVIVVLVVPDLVLEAGVDLPELKLMEFLLVSEIVGGESSFSLMFI